MRVAFLASLVLATAMPAGDAAARRRAAPDPGQACRAAIAQAEREAALPPGLLLAIGLVETGRTDRRGRFTPWAWSLRAAGSGRVLDSKADAVREVARLRAAGISSIDVGCLQVNLHFHGEAFRSVAVAFDPLANARYAARFLKRLEAELGDLPSAVAAYHSRTPSRGAAYRARVMAAWPGGEEVALAALAPLPLPPPEPLVELAEAPR